MKFGFDIDDTLINLREHAFHIYREKLQQDVPISVFHALDRVEIHEPFGLTDTQGKEMWSASLEEIYYTSCPPYPNAVDTLLELEENGHEIYYITARPGEHGERTKKWMAAQGFPIRDDRFFCGVKDEEKVEIIRELQLDCYVDDKPAVVNTLKEDPIHVLLKDQTYNRHLDLPRLLDWAAFKSLTKG
ncbi:5' nucleotidase, NT5C type [Planococcus lenghuensis]|uniref:Nucleotidase n=1 Tax=Planococcus lenghuensis TaxID=2213202 RepID=A0A1Q2KUT5_9BACL|nr:hypothetical protein [Planococcus lenghuensis]AQQ51884.1 hypothetical protein B0X71_01290 [Planococcus lenghuensis]